LLDPPSEAGAEAAVAAGASDVLPAYATPAALRRAVAARQNEVEAARAARGVAGPTAETREGMAFRTMAESGIVGISFFGLDGRVIDANDRYLAMVGADRDALRAGQVRWDRLTPPEWMPRTLEAVRELERHGRCTPF